MIDLVPCYADRNLYLRLAKDYVKTLQQYDSEIIWDERTWLDHLWDANFIMEDRTVQGFLNKEKVQFDFYPPVLYIAEFYVVPEARKRRVGIEAVKEAIKGWSGDVFLYVLNQNRGARIFWNNVEAELGWKRINRPEIRQEEGCELMVYKTEW